VAPVSPRGTLSGFGNPVSRQARTHRIPPQSGHGLQLRAGQTLRVLSPLDEQVADVVAFAREDSREWLSSGRTFDYAESIRVVQGSVLYSNRSNAMFTVTEDTVGCHDFLLTPCSQEMFAKQGISGHHPSCLENLALGLKPYGIGRDAIPTSLNLFMRVEVDGESGRISILPPPSRAGDFVDLRAEMDLIVAVSACSAELSNNGTFKPIDVVVLEG
jgi:uncharacterized protein YcgI (DUF1989 family)